MREKQRTIDTPDVRINLGQAHEVGYWTGKWGCTVQQLRDAVNTVGPMMKDVQRKLGLEQRVRRFE